MIEENHLRGLRNMKTLSRAAADAKKKTAEARERKAKKKAARKDARPTNKKAAKKKVRQVKNSKDVEGWFRDGIAEIAGRRYLTSAWGPKERTLAINLLKHYGDALVEKAVKWFCSNWDDLVVQSQRNGRKLEGMPTVNLLWALREMVFGAVQTSGRKPKPKNIPAKESDEYRETEEEIPTIGW